MELKGKIAIVTGSGRGIGQGIALVLAREGADIVVNDLNANNCQETVQKVQAMGRKAIGVGADVTKKDQVSAMVAQTVEHFGRIDILVNNAGTEAPACQLKDLPEEQWDRILNINLKSVFLCSQAVIPQMIKQNKGRIVNISSIAGMRMTFFGSAEYTASKHGMNGLTQHLAWELADANITVNGVAPGGVVTPLMESGTSAEIRETVVRRLVPLGRFCTIEEIGEAVSFLASDRADMITGLTIPVEGGLLQGYGEDMRAFVRKRMAEEKAHKK